MLHGHGVDDVHIIIAISLHRKMTPAEMKRMSGDLSAKNKLALDHYFRNHIDA